MILYLNSVHQLLVQFKIYGEADDMDKLMKLPVTDQSTDVEVSVERRHTVN